MNPILVCLLPSKASINLQYTASSVVGSSAVFDGPLWLGVDACSTLAPNFAATNLLTIIGLEICRYAPFILCVTQT